VAFYGHKNFIIIFNNLGKHIAASEANPELSKVFPQFSFAFCPKPSPRTSLSPGIYARRAFPALYMPGLFWGDGQNTDGHGYGQWSTVVAVKVQMP